MKGKIPMKVSPAANRHNADQAYIQRHANVVALLEKLNEHVQNLPAENNGRWDTVGSLSHVQELLENVAEFLGVEK
jgi:hypothetical protein